MRAQSHNQRAGEWLHERAHTRGMGVCAQHRQRVSTGCAESFAAQVSPDYLAPSPCVIITRFDHVWVRHCSARASASRFLFKRVGQNGAGKRARVRRKLAAPRWRGKRWALSGGGYGARLRRRGPCARAAGSSWLTLAVSCHCGLRPSVPGSEVGEGEDCRVGPVRGELAAQVSCVRPPHTLSDKTS